MRQEQVSVRSEVRSSMRPSEEANAKRRLERRDALGGRLLRDHQADRRLSKLPRVGDGDERTNVIEPHVD